MITYDGQPLFDSGPARLHVGGLALRTAEQPAPYADGTNLVGHGREARPITQTGTLLADDVASMSALMDAIEDQVDGVARTLTDEDGRPWDHTVMLRFTPGRIASVGPRCRVDYTIDYLQVKP
ncbi:MAG: hypothetical protein AAF911_06255 [Planctomycetota bacterium]